MNGANKVMVGWVIGVAIVLLLIGLSVYTGYGKHPSEKTPSAVTQPQQMMGSARKRKPPSRRTP